jgi:hypothetical protein
MNLVIRPDQVHFSVRWVVCGYIEFKHFNRGQSDIRINFFIIGFIYRLEAFNPTNFCPVLDQAVPLSDRDKNI